MLYSALFERSCCSGTGKSTYMRRHLAELPASEWATINITLSARTSAGALQEQVQLLTCTYADMFALKLAIFNYSHSAVV